MHDPWLSALDVAFWLLLVAGGWMDHRERTVTVVLLALMGFAAVGRVVLVGASAATVGVPVGVAAVGAGLAAVRLVGAADVVAAACLVAFVQRAPGELAWTTLGVALCATLFWYARRVLRSLAISGAPRSPWDLPALLVGRLEAEPRLQDHQIATRHEIGTGATLRYLEAMRTPDGHHLWPDPCPLVSCMAIGWSAGLLRGLLSAN